MTVIPSTTPGRTPPPAPVDPDSGPLLDPTVMARLDQLDVMSRKMLAGKLKGERRSKRRGQSVEFADYRNYTIGDDLRFIDWNIYARLDRLFLKLFLEEEDLAMYIVLDVSKSSDYGKPNKFRYMQRVAAAAGYIGLVNHNRVVLCGVSDGLVADTGDARPAEGVAARQLHRKAPADGPQPHGRGLPPICAAAPFKGVCVVLSDFFVKEGFESGLRYVAGGKYDLFAVQCLAPQELEPDLQGDLKLRDMEDDDLAEVSITQPLIKQYKANLNAYCLSLKEYVTSAAARTCSPARRCHSIRWC